MKIVIGIIGIIICILLGYILGLKYFDRKKFYNDFCTFNKYYLDGVSFYGNSIKEIIAQHNVKNSDFYVFMSEYFNTKKFVFNKKYLTENEKSYLFHYVSSIGKNDMETEKKFATASLEKLNSIFTECEQEESKFRPLYIKLGLFVGLIIFIIII